MVTALGVAPDKNGNGVDPLTHRRIIMGRWAATGVIRGLDVSGRSDLRYNVSEGNAVCSRADSGADGYTEVWWPGGQSPAVPAGDPSNPRVDVVWVRANDPTQGDADNQVTVGVSVGTPAASPQFPSTPDGAVWVGSRLVPAGMTSTQGAQSYAPQYYAIPYGASLGRLGYAENNQTLEQAFDDTWYVQCTATTGNLPTERLVDVVWTARASSSDASRIASYYVKIQDNGVDVTDGGDEVPVFWVHARSRLTFPLRLSEGVHRVTVLARCNTNEAHYWWRGVRNVEVIDRGVSVG
ncbi:hypothetical protein [Bifidobacterium tissieri]|uniref:hypothetical protein n=1 Tax=Bifidobacterium tissieri TaxID=1630162 RepID=UPI00123C4D5B|nr:hypothetical protein [Bifidobacterium tissieri]KAA8828322.1 hypothetical protein EM849_11785 [Bifidobacterium tissieri]